MTNIEIAQKLRDAALNSTPIHQISLDHPNLTVEQAMEIQASGLELALENGDSLCGYKMGLTSKAKQRDVNVHEPIRGYLLKSYEISKFGTVKMAKRIHPRVEPEIAVVLKAPLKGPGIELRDVIRNLEGIYLALEIVDSRFQNFQFKLADVLADNTSAAGFMLGRVNLLDQLNELNLMGIVVRKNGEIVETGAPAGALGDPLLSVVSLANSLGTESKSIEAGQVILTGGLTNSLPFKAGDRIEISGAQETLSFTAV